MMLLRWQPFQEVEAIQHQVDQVFDELTNVANGYRTAWFPAIELKEDADSLTLKALLPGIPQEDLDIQVTRKAVMIAGEYRKTEEENPNHRYYRSEFNYGKFRRVVALPIEVDNAQASAKLENGILTLTLPKTREALNRVVKVSLTQGQPKAEPVEALDTTATPAVEQTPAG